MVIELRDVSYKIEEKTILSNINLRVEEGDFLSIIGESGSGKSTLLRLLNGLIKPSSGSVLVNGVDINSKGFDLKKLREKVGLLFQFPEHQIFEETVLKEVYFGPKSYKKDIECAKKALARVNIAEDKWYSSPLSLSGGEKRRVAFASLLALESDVYILDEPTSGLDRRGRDELFNLLRELNEKNKTIIFVSHSPFDIYYYSKNILLLENGRVKEYGDRERIMKADSSYIPEIEKVKREFNIKERVENNKELALALSSLYSRKNIESKNSK